MNSLFIRATLKNRSQYVSPKCLPWMISICVLISGCSNKPEEINQQSTEINKVQQPLEQENIEFNSIADLEEQLAKVSTDNIEAYAQTIAEVDGWLFDANQEVAAREKIDAAIVKLRTTIATTIEKLLKDAVNAKDGKASNQIMSQINTLLLLYPTPSNETQRNALQTLVEKISQTSKRIEDLSRSRYNQWAISQIERFLTEYHQILKVNKFSELKKLVNTDKEALIKTSGNYLSKIDTLYLEPVVMDLYSHAFEQSKQAIGEDEVALIKLTRTISNPSVQRKSPADF